MEPKRIRLLMADDDAVYRARFKQTLMLQPDIDLIAEAGDGAAAMEQIMRLRPDVAVIDAVLPRLDGLSVLRRLGMLTPEDRPRVVMLTYPGAQYIETTALKLGASVCIEHGTADEALCDVIRRCVTGTNDQLDTIALTAYTQAVEEILTRIRMRSQLDGYAYLAYGVPLVCMDGALMRGITTRIYPLIAQRFQTSSGRVERSIRHAVETTFSAGDYRAIDEIFGNTVDPQRGKPTNGEFIALLAETARMRVRRRWADVWKDAFLG